MRDSQHTDLGAAHAWRAARLPPPRAGCINLRLHAAAVVPPVHAGGATLVHSGVSSPGGTRLFHSVRRRDSSLTAPRNESANIVAAAVSHEEFIELCV